MSDVQGRLKGSMPALVTPFRGAVVDEQALRRLVAWHLAEGSHGLVPAGTTGESATLSHEEHRRVVEICVEEVAGRIPVVAGAGSNSTVEAIALTRHAKAVGADAVLSVAPYYNKPTQEGIYCHFAAIAEAADIPIGHSGATYSPPKQIFRSSGLSKDFASALFTETEKPASVRVTSK